MIFNSIEDGSCKCCSTRKRRVYHNGKCPHIASIEYHKNGVLRKVTFLNKEKFINLKGK